MEEKTKQTFRDLLGINKASPTIQTASTVIGGLLGLGGFIGALNANDKTKTYTQATRTTQARVNQILPEGEARNIEAQKALNDDLSAYQSKTEAGVKQGLINRGITDPGIGEQSAGQVKAGLSGAYAMAASALAGAKLNAGRAVSGALSTYKQALAKKQYESQLYKYYGKLGLWSALGGAATSLMETETDVKSPDKPIENTVFINRNPKLNLYDPSKAVK